MIEAHHTLTRQPSSEAKSVSAQQLASKRASQARTRAELQRAPGLFDGEAALKEVLRENGVWNWVLVGPAPLSLPLSGGGSKGVDELRSVVEERAHSFGFLRLKFHGAHGQSLTRWVYIHTSEENCVQLDMERTFCRWATWSARVCVDCEADCVPETFIDSLHAAAESDEERALLTWDGYRAAQDTDAAVSRPGHELTVASLQVSRFRSGDVHHEASSTAPISSFMQRRRVKLFAQGPRRRQGVLCQGRHQGEGWLPQGPLQRKHEFQMGYPSRLSPPLCAAKISSTTVCQGVHRDTPRVWLLVGSSARRAVPGLLPMVAFQGGCRERRESSRLHQPIGSAAGESWPFDQASN